MPAYYIFIAPLWKKSLLGRSRKYQLGFLIGALRVCNRDNEEKPLLAVHLTVASKERMSELFQQQSESNYEEKLHPPRVSWDLSLFTQQKTLPELFRISLH